METRTCNACGGMGRITYGSSGMHSFIQCVSCRGTGEVTVTPRQLTDAQREALARALAHVKIGKAGTEQPEWLREYLQPLETQGYLSYSTEKGWQLTSKGKEVISYE